MAGSIPLVLMLGQSNMRLSSVSLAAAGQVAAQGGLVVHHAFSGSSLSADLDRGAGDWSAADRPDAGEHLDSLIEKLDALLDPGSRAHVPGAYLAGVIWVQGEADSASAAAAAAYGANLVALRDTLAARYGAHDWQVAALSADVWNLRTAGGAARQQNWLTVRDQQLALDAEPGFEVLDTDALARANGFDPATMFQSDYVHYTDAFGAVLGDALAGGFGLSGQGRLLTGTTGNDVISVGFAGSGGIYQVFASGGTDTADFSLHGAGIRVTAYARNQAAVEGLAGHRDFHADLVDVERVIGTESADVFRLGVITRDVRALGGNDRLLGGPGPDVARMGDGDDVAVGRAGNDVLLGEAGNDRLVGRRGDDRLLGGSGDDRLVGGAGNDQLTGGAGNDILRPQAGSDELIFHAGNNGSDRVYRFSMTSDRLVLAGLELTPDDLVFSTVGEDLLLQVDTARVSAEILLVNRADFLPDFGPDGTTLPDWLVI